MMPFFQVAAVTPHPLNGTAAEWIWLVLLLPAVGAVLNLLFSIVSEWKPGPSDPDPKHAGGDHAHGDAHAEGHDDAHGAEAGGKHKWFLATSIVGVGSVLAAFGVAVSIFAAMRNVEMHEPFVRNFYQWITAGDVRLSAGVLLDPLSMVMMLVITGVGTLIHLFSVGYMGTDRQYPRYFAYLNLFVFFMLLLVLGSSYPVLFIGWEGVGLCSYLLIGFWFEVTANANAGKKAFIVNRIGDFGMLVAMFIMFATWKTLDVVGLHTATAGLSVGSGVATAVALLLFLGCTGKSAQIPLYIWLPDAMAGPTPVSALIHAATMVTAGVYLVARSNFLFALAPVASLTVVTVGSLTALFAATIGLKQWDIKKVLAYSTVSQLGYMFAGVGAGAYVAGIFHLTTHAFFKALLFLGSGSVIHAMHHAYHKTGRHDDAQDMRNMGGLARYLPVTCVTMWLATLAIAGIPPLSGFFSKDEIVASVFVRGQGTTLADATFLGMSGHLVMNAAYVMLTAAAAITAVYMTRMMWYTFHGENRTGPGERGELHESPWTMTLPLIVLAIASVGGGWLNLPGFLALGPTGGLEHWLEPVVGAGQAAVGYGTVPAAEGSTEMVLVGVAVAIAVLAVAFALWTFRKVRLVTAREDTRVEHGFWKVLQHKYYVEQERSGPRGEGGRASEQFSAWRSRATSEA